MRARQEAAREAARPITVAQIVALVAAAGRREPQRFHRAVAVALWRLGGLPDVVGSVTSLATVRAPSSMFTQGWVLSAVMIGLGVWLVLAPVAIYFAVADD